MMQKCLQIGMEFRLFPHSDPNAHITYDEVLKRVRKVVHSFITLLLYAKLNGSLLLKSYAFIIFVLY